jgi:TolB-like protein
MVKIQADKSLEYLMTEATLIYAALASESAINSLPARRYDAWADELREVQDQIDKRIRMIRFDD